MKSGQIEDACDCIAKFLADEQKIERCIGGISVTANGNFSLRTFNVKFGEITIEVIHDSRRTKISVSDSVIFLAEREGRCTTYKIREEELGQARELHFLVAVGLLAKGMSLLKSLGVFADGL